MVDATDIEAVRVYLRAHRSEIIERYQAEGVGIGRLTDDDPRYAIVVYLDSENKRPIESVVLEGIPIKFEVTGRFQPLMRLFQRMGCGAK